MSIILFCKTCKFAGNAVATCGLFFCVFPELTSGFCLVDDPTQESLRREAGSWFSAMESNLDALTTGDVFVRVRTSFDSNEEDDDDAVPDGFVDLSDVVFRLRFDYQKQRYLLAKVAEGVRIDFKKQNEDSPDAIREGRGYDGFIYSDGEGVIASSYNPTRKMPVKNLPKTLQSYGVPDFRNTGFVTFRTGLPAEYIPKVKARLTTPENVAKLTSQKDRVCIKLITRVPHSPGTDYVDVYQFATEKLVLTEIESMSISFKPKRKEYFGSRQTFKWAEFGGIMLPTKIRETAPSLRPVDGRREVATQEMDVDIHWISVNKDFEESDFDESVIRKYEKMMQFVEEGKREAQSGKADDRGKARGSASQKNWHDR